MDSLAASLTGCGDYDYADDFTDISEDHDLPLPGLHAPRSSRPWPGGDDWCLPGLVQQSDITGNSGSSSGSEDSGGESEVRVDTQGSRSSDMRSADLSQREPWRMQLDVGAASPSAPGHSALGHARFAGSASMRGAMLPLRSGSTTSGRPLFGPFESSSLQHRDSFQAMQLHPLTLTVQHHQHVLPPPSQQPTPAQPLTLTLPPTREQQKDQEPERRRGGRAGSTGSGLEEEEEEDVEEGRREERGARGDPWSYLDADPFVLAASSSCSSSLSASRDPSPQQQPTAAQPFSVPIPGPSNVPQPWYRSQYDDSQFEHDFALGLGPQRRQPSSGARGSGRLNSRDGDRRGLGSLELELGEGPAADNTHGSDGASDSSHSSWAGRAGLDPRYDGTGPSTSQSAAPSAVFWQLGGPRDGLRSGAGTRPAGIGAVGDAGWPLRPADSRHQHFARNRAGDLSTDWRPFQLDEGSYELGAPMAGTSSSALQSLGGPSWEHQYGGGRGDRSSLGLSLGGSSGPGHGYSPRSTLGDGDFSGLGPSPPALATRALRGGTPGGLRAHRMNGFAAGGSGLNGSGGVNGSSGTTLCFTSLDSPSGPYERRRVVLTSAHRRHNEVSPPSVRQYSDGLAGMLTNAQIQEWMSQHASRLLLPRHMQEIADMVFRPPSAVPEKKPLNCQSSGITTLPPPVVLGGRYAPLHITRLVCDSSFMADLLAGLSGVDPTNSRVMAVITALQGKDVVVAEEGEDGALGPAGRTVLTKGLRSPSQIQPK